jgi:hypothetical protein
VLYSIKKISGNKCKKEAITAKVRVNDRNFLSKMQISLNLPGGRWPRLSADPDLSKFDSNNLLHPSMA